jgi:hypothetical protein
MMKAFTQVPFITQTCLASVLLFTAINVVGAIDPNVPSAQIRTDTASDQVRMGQYYTKPFATNSLWNSRPISPSFSDFVIPLAKFNPLIDSGIYSSGCFFADDKSGPMIVKPIPGSKGVYDADAETSLPQVEISHWPADLVPAAGGDGHADIYDVSTGIIHSFWRLKNINGVWTANLYAWSPINGSGWGDPSHYYHGARAVGIGACAGIIRKHEYTSSDPIYPHALAMSLDTTGAAPGYVYPATSADHYSATNIGKIPEGALVMLPPSFNVSQLKTPELIKIANTLRVYGAYVVDGNYGTPFVIYAETGSGLNLHKNGYNLKAANELHLIRQSLRMVTSVKSWIDASGRAFIPEKNLNILSMRGPWGVKRGTVWDKADPLVGKFNTWKQAVVFGPTTSRISQSNPSGRSISQISWAKPIAGEKFKLTAITTGGGQLRLIMYDQQWKTRVDTYDLANGQSASFVWPAGELYFSLYATSGIGPSSSVSGTLLRVK